jgi:uncharacterized protein involved in exopolysaccharide biosynthesis
MTLQNRIHEHPSKADIGLVELAIAVAKHKKRIVGITVACGVLAFCGSFALPNYYMANTKLLPPQQGQSGAAALLSQLGGGASLAAGMVGLKNPNELYIGMLKSRTVADHLIEQFGLKKVYDTDSQENARRILSANTVITSGKDGIISIEVEGKDQKLVAKLANGYTAELRKVASTLAITEAAQRRMFFERELETAKNNLARAEVTLKATLDTHGVVSVDSQSRVLVETIGRLRALISANEIQIESMRAFVTENNPNFRRLTEELKSQRAELSRLENGAGADSLVEKKQGGLENIKLLRDVKYYQMLYELLSKQYEVARLDEAQEPSIIQVLDPAAEPERKFKPKRAVIAVLASLLTALANIAWIFFAEVRQRFLRSPGGETQWAELKENLGLSKAD